MTEAHESGTDKGRLPNALEESDLGWTETLRLGHDLRFLLVTVGGGAARIGRAIAAKHLRYVETIAINCDSRVQELDDFDRRVCLGPDSGEEADTGGSPRVGAELARAAEPALERIFEGATFVTIIGSLGGGAGTGALPYVLEAAARASEVLSVFLVKPFACEGARRAVADRALARLMFLESFNEKQEQKLASLHVLDNESLVPHASKIPIGKLNELWAGVIARHIEHSFVAPAEAVLEAARIAMIAEGETLNRAPVFVPDTIPATEELPLPPPSADPRLLPAASGGRDIELTFEVEQALPQGKSL
ncbi:MAG TPA: hypothetical protein VJS68_03585 [Thermoplasmata archaeon]|nr:hypothetical protein [Thermoplasmata archaeon]